LNACINKLPDENRQGQKLFDRVEKSCAATLDIGKPDKVEQRQAKWATFDNVNVYFDSLKEFFIYFGFATIRGDEHCPG
jgi:hypothetical protein